MFTSVFRGRGSRRKTLTTGTLGVVLLASMLLPALVPAVAAAPITIVDSAGADDVPGQKDLNFLTVDYAPSSGAGTIRVQWGWDDTATSGNNTRDACTLFDTDDDGFANYSVCVTVQTNGSVSTSLYECTADNRSDRCAGPSEITTFASIGTASIVPDSDPFGVVGSAHYHPKHVSGNVCRDRPGCHTDDTVADLTVHLSDLGNDTNPFLLNVCSYPSQEPNSSPSDCVVTPNAGFLTIVKDATPSDGPDFVFNLATGQKSDDGSTSWTITGSGSEPQIPFIAGTYTLKEAIPSGWKLDSASC